MGVDLMLFSVFLCVIEICDKKWYSEIKNAHGKMKKKTKSNGH